MDRVPVFDRDGRTQVKRTVAYIIGTSYCGSSLLNLLLDSLERTRGLGEAVNLTVKDSRAQCGRCLAPIQECSVRTIVDPQRFYGSLFDHYGDCDVLVDSSKWLSACVDSHRFESDLEHKVILLSKAPHEFVASWVNHHPEDSADKAFRRYMEFYMEHIALLRERDWFRPDRCLRMTYRQVATRTEDALKRAASFLGSPFRQRRCRWQSDTHIVGGNWIVAAQLSGQTDLFTDSTWYLKGKYAGKYRAIFLDDQWRKNRTLTERCRKLYYDHQQAMSELLNDLGQLDFQQQITDLEFALKPCKPPELSSPFVQ